MAGPFVVLTGASGVGKTTIAFAIEKAHPEYSVFRFDAIGVPSPEVIAGFGSGHEPGGAWQRAMTLQWLERIAPILVSGRPVLFEGQMRIAFIQEALAVHNISHARVILVECDDETRNFRLTHDRQQPELANESMMGWSRYLHREAQEAGYEILDTRATTLSEGIERIRSYLKLTGPAIP
jgi:energy-coupling factor transporter ATP-binding protein EcfA2